MGRTAPPSRARSLGRSVTHGTAQWVPLRNRNGMTPQGSRLQPGRGAVARVVQRMGNNPAETAVILARPQHCWMPLPSREKEAIPNSSTDGQAPPSRPPHRQAGRRGRRFQEGEPWLQRLKRMGRAPDVGPQGLSTPECGDHLGKHAKTDACHLCPSCSWLFHDQGSGHSSTTSGSARRRYADGSAFDGSCAGDPSSGQSDRSPKQLGGTPRS
jgi:hypothetical protein